MFLPIQNSFVGVKGTVPFQIPNESIFFSFHLLVVAVCVYRLELQLVYLQSDAYFIGRITARHVYNYNNDLQAMIIYYIYSVQAWITF